MSKLQKICFFEPKSLGRDTFLFAILFDQSCLKLQNVQEKWTGAGSFEIQTTLLMIRCVWKLNRTFLPPQSLPIEGWQLGKRGERRTKVTRKLYSCSVNLFQPMFKMTWKRYIGQNFWKYYFIKLTFTLRDHSYYKYPIFTSI